ncbi:MAG TPA: YtxH domain-containing protein [Vicinamibacterales bacterium]|jgi:gas vesicle protein
MAYEYDRFEREEGGGSFLMGLLAGTVLGAGLGMLFAPKSGSELRSQLGNTISDGTGRIRDAADQTYSQASEKVNQMMDRGRDAYDRARSTVNNMASQGTTGSTPAGSSQPSASSGSTGSGNTYGA